MLTKSNSTFPPDFPLLAVRITMLTPANGVGLNFRVVSAHFCSNTCNNAGSPGAGLRLGFGPFVRVVRVGAAGSPSLAAILAPESHAQSCTSALRCWDVFLRLRVDGRKAPHANARSFFWVPPVAPPRPGTPGSWIQVEAEGLPGPLAPDLSCSDRLC